MQQLPIIGVESHFVLLHDNIINNTVAAIKIGPILFINVD
jgi:hypothetical protein